MRLQLALDAPEHFALLPRLAGYFDLVEVGTPLLKRFGLSAVTTAIELGGGRPVLADTKTVDAGGLEAEMVLGAGARWMTVLAGCSAPTRERAGTVAAAYDATLVFDTILEPDPTRLTPTSLAAGEVWLALHSASDLRGSAADDGSHISRVTVCKQAGFRVSLAGGITRQGFAPVADVAPDIVVLGSGVTGATDPEGEAAWLRQAADKVSA